MADDEPIIRPNFSGAPSIRGTRLSMYSIMDFHFAGESAEFISESFGITLDEANAAMRYIDEHREELMPRYSEILERNRRGDPPHIRAMYAKSHENLMRVKGELDKKSAAKTETIDARAAG